MTRRAWTVVIVMVAVLVAAVAGTAVLAAVLHHREVGWPQMQGVVQNAPPGLQNGQSGQGWQGGGSRGNGGYRWNGGNGSGRRLGAAVMMGRGGWQPLRGLPWLVLGLLVGAGVTLLIWQPWKRPALAAVATGESDAQATADTWAQWHRDLHATEEATTQPPATPAVNAATEPKASAETTAEMPAEPDPLA